MPPNFGESSANIDPGRKDHFLVRVVGSFTGGKISREKVELGVIIFLSLVVLVSIYAMAQAIKKPEVTPENGPQSHMNKVPNQ